jgi:serine/threonine protein kinase
MSLSHSFNSDSWDSLEDRFRTPGRSKSKSKSRSSIERKSKSKSNSGRKSKSKSSSERKSEHETMSAETESSSREVKSGELGKGTYGIVFAKDGMVTKQFKYKISNTKGVPEDFLKEAMVYDFARNQLRNRFKATISPDYNMSLEMKVAGSGDTFYKYTGQLDPTSKNTKRMFFQLTSLLSHYHSAHITNNDIKPQNILMNTRKNKAYLIDWGISNIVGTYGMSQSTFTYTCPEFAVMQTHRIYTTPSITAQDIWGLGMCLLEATAGTVIRYYVDSFRVLLDDIFAAFVNTTPGRGKHPYIRLIDGKLDGHTTKKDHINSIKRRIKAIFKEKRKPCDDAFCDLLANMLSIRGDWRATAAQLVKHRYFKTGIKLKPLENRMKFAKYSADVERNRELSMLAIWGYTLCAKNEASQNALIFAICYMKQFIKKYGFDRETGQLQFCAFLHIATGIFAYNPININVLVNESGYEHEHRQLLRMVKHGFEFIMDTRPGLYFDHGLGIVERAKDCVDDEDSMVRLLTNMNIDFDVH